MAPFLDRQFDIVRRCGHLSDDRPAEAMHERWLDAPDPAGTVLYIHGLGESSLCFERLMADERLAHWRHLAVDLVGYGKSAWAAEPLSLDQHAERLERLVRRHEAEAQLGPLVVLGHSMGGVIGTRLCQLLGAGVRGFVNVEGNVSLPDCGYSGQAVKYSLDEWLASGFDQVLDAIHHHEGESAEVRHAYGASILMCDPRAYHRNSQELVEVSTAEAGARGLAALDAAVHYVHGAPRGAGPRTLELLARAGVETTGVEGAGHWPFLDRPDAFVEAMAGWLDRLGGVI